MGFVLEMRRQCASAQCIEHDEPVGQFQRTLRIGVAGNVSVEVGAGQNQHQRTPWVAFAPRDDRACGTPGVQCNHECVVVIGPLRGQPDSVCSTEQARPAVRRLPVAIVGIGQCRGHDDKLRKMHATSIAPDTSQAEAARNGGADVLAQAVLDCRRDTLSTFESFITALPDLKVPLHPEVNPPLWELGHIGWFQDHWIARNPHRHLGWDADPTAIRAHVDDELYDSSAVPHDSRGQLKLPDVDETRVQLAEQLERTLSLLRGMNSSDPRALYFYRLVLLHEDMHHEAELYMAQHLGIPMNDERWKRPAMPEPSTPLQLLRGTLTLGGDMLDGFRFDNECGQRVHQVEATTIDAQVVRWAEYLPAVEAGANPMPRYLRREGSIWTQWRHGQWSTLDMHEPACHLNAHEATAWCRWAGRRLPTEAEWVWASRTQPGTFRWGDVWEWTATAFGPFAGFQSHPYRDYSLPGFDGRPVLRGASFLTQPRLRHPDYRNFFPATRNDIPAGFRTCAR